MAAKNDITKPSIDELLVKGYRVGKLVVIKEAEKRKYVRFFLCQCDCGNTKEVSAYALRDKHTKSCGCLNIQRTKEANTKHGMHGCAEYSAWKNMRKRCNNQNDPRYKDYGARGIRVCKRWGKFENFLDDIGSKPSAKHSIDRINNNLGYKPSNCRWATDTEQAHNQRLKKNNTSGYSGIKKHEKSGMYRVSIGFNGKSKYIGSYRNLRDAKKARREAEDKYWA